MTIQKYKVIVVDDDPDKRNLLAIALEMAGYEVRLSFDGEQALRSIESNPPDLIITDVMMPKMDGYELARRVRANPQTRYIPIIIQTAARGDAQGQRHAAQVGALGFITDPTDFDLLLASARTLLDFKGYLDTVEEAARRGGYKVKPAARQSDHPKSKDEIEAERRHKAATEIIKNKITTGSFDVFLCHNSDDKESVKKIYSRLTELGILPWLDEMNLRPGLPWQIALEEHIDNIKSAAVFVGKSGIGPWQRQELSAFINEFVRRGCPVIPVLLEDVEEAPKLPVFLKAMTWVDFRKDQPDPLKQLTWGITGEKNIVL